MSLPILTPIQNRLYAGDENKYPKTHPLTSNLLAKSEGVVKCPVKIYYLFLKATPLIYSLKYRP